MCIYSFGINFNRLYKKINFMFLATVLLLLAEVHSLFGFLVHLWDVPCAVVSLSTSFYMEIMHSFLKQFG